MKTKILILTAFLTLGLLFQSCEKEETESITTTPSSKVKVISSKSNSAATKATAVWDDNGKLKDCKGDPDNCTISSSLPWVAAPNSPVFTDEGTHVPNSFNTYYELILEHFTQGEIDGVINGTLIVNREENNDKIFVAFRNSAGGLISAYMYEE